MVNVYLLIISAWIAFIAGYFSDGELPLFSPIRIMEGIFTVMSVIGLSVGIALTYYVFIGKPFGLFIFF
jgi:hypothetical protein